MSDTPPPASPIPGIASVAIGLLAAICGGLGTPVLVAIVRGALHARGGALTAAEVIPGSIALLGGLLASVLGAWSVSTGSGGARATGCFGMALGLVVICAGIGWIGVISGLAAFPHGR